MDIIVKKHLRRQKIDPRVHFLLQVLDVVRLVLVLHVPFRIAGRPDAKVTILPNLFHQFVRVPKPVGGGKRHPLRNVPPQGKNVLDAQRLQVGNHLSHLILRGRGARQVRKAFHAQIALDVVGNPRRVLARAAAGAVRDADVGRLKRRDAVRRLHHLVHPGIRLWWKHFERNTYFVTTVQLVYNLHPLFSQQPNGLSMGLILYSPSSS